MARLRSSVHSLQEEVLAMLAEARSTVGRAREALTPDPLCEDLDKTDLALAAAIRKVRGLELRMAIVAPMKAGKSTIVNAIFGQELLPSRITAMTALPTEISFNAEIEEPILQLSDATHDEFMKVAVRISGVLRTKGGAEVGEDLRPLVQRLKQQCEIPRRAQGSQSVLEVLSDLNDLIRLCRNSVALLDEHVPDPVPALGDFPRVQTPLWPDRKRAAPTLLGNLVLVDTPGPNEARAGHVLQSVVRDQLRQSALILLVLDYTQLNSSAAEEVNRTVREVLELEGKDEENLYVLVNKIDQRDQREGGKDLTPQGVLDFIAHDLGLRQVVERGQVFEISAREAFAAREFFKAMNREPKMALDGDAAKLLAQIKFGRHGWKRFLSEIRTLERLQEEAEELWEVSGFPRFLEQAMYRLFEEAAPLCLQEALGNVRIGLEKAYNRVETRQGFAQRDTAELVLQLRALEQDLDRLRNLRRDLQKEIGSFRESVQQAVEKRIAELCRNARVAPETYLEESAGEGELWRAVRGRLRKGGKRLEFSGNKDKRRFESLLEQDTAERLRLLGSSCQQILESAVRAGRERLSKLLEGATAPVVHSAQIRIEQSFSVNLAPPSFDLPQKAPGKIEVPVTKRVKGKPGRIETRNGYLGSYVHRDPYWNTYTIFNLFLKSDEWIEGSEKAVWESSLEEAAERVNHTMDRLAEEILKAARTYLQQDFENYVESFFTQLDGYLLSCQTSLDEELRNKGLSQAERKRVAAALDFFKRDASALLDHLGRCRHRATVLAGSGFDFFVAHAGEDRDFVEALIASFLAEKLEVWDGRSAVLVDDDIQEAIDQGLSECRYGLVVLSQHFAKREWPRYELEGLLAREKGGRKLIIPILKEVTVDEIHALFPNLKNRFALRYPDMSAREIVQRIVKDLRMKGGLPSKASSSH